MLSVGHTDVQRRLEDAARVVRTLIEFAVQHPDRQRIQRANGGHVESERQRLLMQRRIIVHVDLVLEVLVVVRFRIGPVGRRAVRMIGIVIVLRRRWVAQTVVLTAGKAVGVAAVVHVETVVRREF